ncbi:MAG TPA: TonB-dependent receptor, partial [Chitinophagales bacterium]|nr:TonB-dependent receptor [Chitinophagales bacterium]
MTVTGLVMDTVTAGPMRDALVTAVRFKDSVLVDFARTDAEGKFELNLPIDTVEITISGKGFGRQTYYVLGSAENHEFDFGRVALPPKSLQLNEVVVYAFKDPVYYKGDTLVYTADSFKVKPNATVEDLLKKLPGVTVDAQGKIKVQGREVDQVLVDGDEFFGTDPTVATKNLSAEGLSTVQVYEKKNENSTEGEETIQVMDLKLKEDAKKGYFGKISAGTDAQKFYEGELLANRFKGSQKVSVFALGANTPRSGFNWQDMDKYGLSNEMNFEQDEDGSTTYYYSSNTRHQGIPRTLKSGVYYNDRLSKTTKLNFNYTYNHNRLNSVGSTRSQFFFPDTSYTTDNESANVQTSNGHNLNLKVTQTIDSLLDLEIEPKLRLNATEQSTREFTRFVNEGGILTRESNVSNNNKSDSYNFSTRVKLTRRYGNRDRLSRLTYEFGQNETNTNGFVKSLNTTYDTLTVNETIDQKQTTAFDDIGHRASAVHTEPLSKKIKLEFEYNFNFGLSTQNKQTQNFINGEYSELDPLFSNDFENEKTTHRLGGKFIYETKKTSFNTGSRYRTVSVLNTNRVTEQKITQHENDWLPFASYNYKFSDNSRLRLRYHTNSNLPTVQQLQPVPDNTNPNRIRIGNPDLLPTFVHNASVNYNLWKPVTGHYIWSSATFTLTDNDFSNNTRYDTLGRSLIQTVNVDGNVWAQLFAGGSINFFDKLWYFNPNVSQSYRKRTNFVNDVRNVTETNTTNLSFYTGLKFDSLEFDVSYTFGYNLPRATLSELANKPYTNHLFTASIETRLPFKFLVETDASYTVNEDRTEGYNTKYLIWNASIH